MLVLSRGQNEKIVFPALGIAVEILRIGGHRVRLGIDAPEDVRVLREELQPHEGDLSQGGPRPSGSRMTHAVRNRLQKATLGLHLLQRKLDAGHIEDLEASILKVLSEFSELERELACRKSDAAPADQCRALVVEDDANESELLAGYLRLSGFEVDTAADGLQAMVRLSRNKRPNVVLLDMKMPRLDGSKTVSAIRENPSYRDMKIFAVSGSRPDEMKVDIGRGGVDRWFTKPVNPRTLVEAIQQELQDECVPA